MTATGIKYLVFLYHGLLGEVVSNLSYAARQDDFSLRFFQWRV